MPVLGSLQSIYWNTNHCLSKPLTYFSLNKLTLIIIKPFSGQTGPKQSILENPGVFLNPEQPLIAAVTITKDDVRRQEDRVRRARQRLQEALGVA